jgi:hypothetical protein
MTKIYKRKILRAFRIVGYYLNCLWYHVLFPIGTEKDEFEKQWKNKQSIVALVLILVTKPITIITTWLSIRYV